MRRRYRTLRARFRTRWDDKVAECDRRAADWINRPGVDDS